MAAPTVNTKAWIRQKFIEETGRFDLVQDHISYVDKGADFFIDAGNKILDMRIEHPKSITRFQKNITAGVVKLEMQRLQSVEMVEVMNAEVRTELSPMDYKEFRKKFNLASSKYERGVPSIYALLENTLSLEQKAITAANYASTFTYDYEDLRFHDNNVFLYDGIIWNPPADVTYTITVHAHFYSHLVEDTDKNFYSVNFPTLLILASKLALYSSYDNTSGIRDTLAAMEVIEEGLDKNLINQEMSRAGLQRKGF